MAEQPGNDAAAAPATPLSPARDMPLSPSLQSFAEALADLDDMMTELKGETATEGRGTPAELPAAPSTSASPAPLPADTPVLPQSYSLTKLGGSGSAAESSGSDEVPASAVPESFHFEFRAPSPLPLPVAEPIVLKDPTSPIPKSPVPTSVGSPAPNLPAIPATSFTPLPEWGVRQQPTASRSPEPEQDSPMHPQNPYPQPIENSPIEQQQQQRDQQAHDHETRLQAQWHAMQQQAAAEQNLGREGKGQMIGAGMGMPGQMVRGSVPAATPGQPQMVMVQGRPMMVQMQPGQQIPMQMMPGQPVPMAMQGQQQPPPMQIQQPQFVQQSPDSGYAQTQVDMEVAPPENGAWEGEMQQQPPVPPKRWIPFSFARNANTPSRSKKCDLGVLPVFKQSKWARFGYFALLALVVVILLAIPTSVTMVSSQSDRISNTFISPESPGLSDWYRVPNRDGLLLGATLQSLYPEIDILWSFYPSGTFASRLAGINNASIPPLSTAITCQLGPGVPFWPSTTPNYDLAAGAPPPLIKMSVPNLGQLALFPFDKQALTMNVRCWTGDAATGATDVPIWVNFLSTVPGWTTKKDMLRTVNFTRWSVTFSASRAGFTVFSAVVIWLLVWSLTAGVAYLAARGFIQKPDPIVLLLPILAMLAIVISRTAVPGIPEGPTVFGTFDLVPQIRQWF